MIGARDYKLVQKSGQNSSSLTQGETFFVGNINSSIAIICAGAWRKL